MPRHQFPFETAIISGIYSKYLLLCNHPWVKNLQETLDFSFFVCNGENLKAMSWLMSVSEIYGPAQFEISIVHENEST